MSLRIMATLVDGRLTPDEWVQAAREEAPVRGKPLACKGCPLAIDGEWEAGASEAVAAMTDAQAATMKRWGCHAEDRPCAGMRRLLKRRAESSSVPTE